MKLYIKLLTIILLTLLLTGCGGGSSDDDTSYFDIVVLNLQSYQNALAWEVWNIGAILSGDDKKDYSFLAKLVVARDGEKIYGFGNANGYDLGNFFIVGERTGDNIEFDLYSQNRYRSFKLTGKGIYLDGNTKIGGNSIEGQDFSTVFGDSIKYSGNFTVTISSIAQPVANVAYDGKINGAYDSIENGDIQLQTSADGSSLRINVLKGNLVGSTQTVGLFEVTDSSVFGDLAIDANRFSKVATLENTTIQIDGIISGSIASGFVLIQKEARTHIGAFTAVVN